MFMREEDPCFEQGEKYFLPAAAVRMVINPFIEWNTPEKMRRDSLPPVFFFSLSVSSGSKSFCDIAVGWDVL